MRLINLAALLWLPSLLSAQYLADNSAAHDTQKIYQAAERAQRNGDITLAIDLYSRVLEQEPHNLNAYLQRGLAHGMNKEHELAIQDLSAVIEHEPKHLWAYLGRGSAYSRLGRHGEALQDLNAVLELDPRNEEAYNNRGWAHKGLGDMEAACKDWRSSQKLGNAEARIILSNTRCK